MGIYWNFGENTECWHSYWWLVSEGHKSEDAGGTERKTRRLGTAGEGVFRWWVWGVQCWSRPRRMCMGLLDLSAAADLCESSRFGGGNKWRIRLVSVGRPNVSDYNGWGSRRRMWVVQILVAMEDGGSREWVWVVQFLEADAASLCEVVKLMVDLELHTAEEHIGDGEGD